MNGKFENMLKTFVLFIICSALGASLRFIIIELLALFGEELALTWGVFVVNVMGCFFFGLGWVYTQERETAARLLLVAFLGSLTTFSTYIYDMYRFIEQGDYGLLFSNGFLQIVIALLFLRLGMCLMQRLQQARKA